MTANLDPRGDLIQIGDIKLSTQGLQGYAELASELDATRAEETSTRLDAELARLGFRDQHPPIVLREVESVAPPPPEDVITTRGQVAGATLITPAPSEGWGQLVVTQQGDLLTFEFPEEAQTTDTVDRGGGELTYTIDLRVPPSSGPDAAERGFVGKILKKVIKVLAFKVAAGAGEGLVSRWEADARKHRLRDIASSTALLDPNGPQVGDAKWREIAGGRALLLIHGTNSQLHTGFHSLPEVDLDRFRERYASRVIGFDHPTLSVSPTENIDTFMELIPRGIDLDLDIVCHSRGGLVARELTQRPRPGSNVNVRKVVFVATPNAGTVLADVKHMKEFINTYTNFLGFLPDNVFTTILESVVTLAKEVALGVLGRLDGLQAMNPSGPYLSGLNQGNSTSAEYAAVATNFEPTGISDFALWARDKLFDDIFDRAKNDLVVPTAGCFDQNGGAGFPIDNKLVFAASDALHHSSFFGNARALDFLNENLTAS